MNVLLFPNSISFPKNYMNVYGLCALNKMCVLWNMTEGCVCYWTLLQYIPLSCFHKHYIFFGSGLYWLHGWGRFTVDWITLGGCVLSFIPLHPSNLVYTPTDTTDKPSTSVQTTQLDFTYIFSLDTDFADSSVVKITKETNSCCKML